MRIDLVVMVVVGVHDVLYPEWQNVFVLNFFAATTAADVFVVIIRQYMCALAFRH